MVEAVVATAVASDQILNSAGVRSLIQTSDVVTASGGAAMRRRYGVYASTVERPEPLPPMAKMRPSGPTAAAR